MTEVEQKLAELRKKAQILRQEEAKNDALRESAEASRAFAMENLKSESGVSTVAEAEELLKALVSKRDTLLEEMEKDLDVLGA